MERKVDFIGSGCEVVRSVFVDTPTMAEAFEAAEQWYKETNQNFHYCEIEIPKEYAYNEQSENTARDKKFDFYKKRLESECGQLGRFRFNAIESMCLTPEIDPVEMAVALKKDGFEVVFDDSSISARENSAKKRQVERRFTEDVKDESGDGLLAVMPDKERGSTMNAAERAELVENVFADVARFIEANEDGQYNSFGIYQGPCVNLGLLVNTFDKPKRQYILEDSLGVDLGQPTRVAQVGLAQKIFSEFEQFIETNKVEQYSVNRNYLGKCVPRDSFKAAFAELKKKYMSECVLDAGLVERPSLVEQIGNAEIKREGNRSGRVTREAGER